MTEMLQRKSWEEFQEAGLIWFINRMLHLFGWAIVLKLNESKIVEVYPARCKFRGFCKDVEERGFKNLTNYLAENAAVLKEAINF